MKAMALLGAQVTIDPGLRERKPTRWARQLASYENRLLLPSAIPHDDKVSSLQSGGMSKVCAIMSSRRNSNAQSVRAASPPFFQ